MPIVVGKLAAQTSSLFILGKFSATANGTAHAKHPVSPGIIN